MTVTAPGQAAADTAAARPGAVQGRGPWRLAWGRLRRDPVAVVSAATLVLIAVAAVAAPLVAHAVGHGPDDQYHDIGVTTAGLPVGPSRTFLLGTDNLGRDLLVRILYGARISLLVGVVATLLATVAGVVLGLAAGYLGGAVDVVLARFMDMVLSFPYLLLAIALVSVFGSSLTISMLVIAFFSWAAIGRVVRGQALSIREKEYVEASWSVGSGAMRVMFVDILPNLLAPVLVLATLLVPAAIVFEATLSFLGLGVPPPTPTWGGMLSDSLAFYQVAWWFPLFPGLALLATTLAFNLLGDGVRDALDPTAGRAGGGGDR
jgi:peptide/nickel transport system permease protein